jgi:hypothetical protein
VRLPIVVSVSFTNRNTRLAVEIDDGRTILAPLSWYPRLQYGTPKERKYWRLVGGGGGIHWPDLDEDVSVENLLSGKRSQESPSSLQRWLDERAATPRRSTPLAPDRTAEPR